MTYPAPINQFSRLRYVSGTKPTGTYALGTRWNQVRNGVAYDGLNCTSAVGAIAIDAHTGGRILSSPPQIRNAQYDWSGGIGLDDVNVAWNRLWPGNQLYLPQAHDWADVIATLKDRRFVAIQGDYDQIPYAYQCQKYGRFDHAFGLGGFRSSDARVLLYDPLCTHAVWIPQYAIRGAAEKLALAQRGTRSRLFVGITKVMATTVTVHWASDIATDIKAAYTASAVATKLRSLGITSYGTAINYSDLEAGLGKRGIDYGGSVQLIDVRALMKAGTGA